MTRRMLLWRLTEIIPTVVFPLIICVYYISFVQSDLWSLWIRSWFLHSCFMCVCVFVIFTSGTQYYKPIFIFRSLFFLLVVFVIFPWIVNEYLFCGNCERRMRCDENHHWIIFGEKRTTIIWSSWKFFEHSIVTVNIQVMAM